MEAHHNAFARRGDQVVKVPNDQFAGLVICHVAENKTEEAIGIEGARWFMHTLGKLFEPLMVKNQLYSYDYLRQVFALNMDPKDATDAQLKDHHMVAVGNPDEVIRKLETFQKAGMSQVILFKQAGRIPHPHIMRSIQRVGKYILPYFNPQRTLATDDIRAAAL